MQIEQSGLLLKRHLIEPHDMKPTHILHREFYKNGRMRITIMRYEDGSFFVNAPIGLSDQDIFSIDWNINTFGYTLTYPNGITTGQYHDTPRNYNESNPFGYRLNSNI